MTRKATQYLTDPNLVLQNRDAIPLVTADTRITYLGRKISPWEGITLEGLEEKFRNTLSKVQRLALKQHQKAQLISTYLVPNYLHTLVLTILPITLIRHLDQELREAINAYSIFHSAW